jgi:hypothetical protein
MSLGFIILRHVNDELTNQYWQYSYKCIRKWYPENKIVIIDDSSNPEFLTTTIELYKTQIIQSQYPKRGELLPYIYYLRNKWFDKAVILHDAVFINRYIDFTNVSKYQILWDFEHKWDQIEDETQMIESFEDPDILQFHKNIHLWTGCFGCMSVITHDYLTEINNRFKIDNLIKFVLTRFNRCSFERVIACLLQFQDKTPNQSMFGNIHQYCRWGITFQQKDSFKHLPLTKVWTGR